MNCRCLMAIISLLKRTTGLFVGDKTLAALFCLFCFLPLMAHAIPYKVLVFSKTAGFRHDSITNGIGAIQSLGAANGFSVDTSEDSAVFTDVNLAQYKAVVFLSTTGDILDANQ